MARRLLRFAYRKFGRRYPRLVLFLQHQMAHLVVVGGVALLALYQPLGDDWWKIVAVGQVLMGLENVLSYRLVSRLLRPADPWLRGHRTDRTAAAAWRALAELPSAYTRRHKKVPLLLNVLPVSVYITWELDLGWESLAFIFGGAVVVLLYGVFLRFFAMELALRPVLEHVSHDLPANFELGEAGLPLRTKLMLALPVLTIISGVIVAGLSADGQATIPELGLEVAVAVAVSFTLALELTVLLARSVVDPLTDLRSATERVARGELDVRVPVTSTDETGRLAQAFNAAVDGLAERERLREAFGAYVDPVLADRVLAEGVALEGEEVDVTVLFIDIRGFTALAERSTANELVAKLNEFFAVIVPVLIKHGGHANKFVGDGLLGVFGAPDRRRDHADRGVAAALEIARLVQERWAGELEIGIGVNSGSVVAGTVGGGGRVEFTVIGDPVNTAARVEEATRTTGDTILLTAATCGLLTRDFGSWEERPAIPLKGKTAVVKLYAPRSPAESSAATAAARAGTMSA